MSTESKPTPTFKKDVVSRKKTAAYTMGPLIDTITSFSYNALIFYYYEVELGLATALVGLSFVIFAIWNMINDPLIGYLTDKPMPWSKKYGLRTPWIIFGGIGLIICYYFLFAVPDIDPKTDPWPLFWYMIIISCLFDTFFTLFNIHWIGGFANIFRTKEERRKGSTLLTMFVIFGQFFFLGILIPFTIVFGDPKSYIRYALIVSIACAISLVIFIPGIYENEFVKKRYLQIYEFLETQRMPYFQFLKTTVKQKNFVVFLIVWTLVTTSNTLQQISSLYFLKEVLKLDIQVLAYTQLVFLITFIPSIIIWSKVAKKTEHVNLMIIGLILVTILRTIAMGITNLTQIIIIQACSGVSAAALVCMLLSVMSDTNDEVVDACGRHVEASLGGVRAFFIRISYLVAGLIIAGVHLATGYVSGASEQTELAQFGIRLHYTGISAIFTLIAAILMIKFYDLKGEKKDQLAASLVKKRL